MLGKFGEVISPDGPEKMVFPQAGSLGVDGTDVVEVVEWIPGSLCSGLLRSGLLGSVKGAGRYFLGRAHLRGGSYRHNSFTVHIPQLLLGS